MIIEDDRTKNKIMDCLKEFTKICCTSSRQDALFQLTMHTYHLIIITDNGTLEITCQLIKAIRKMNEIPIIIIGRGNRNERAMYIKRGADIVLTEDSICDELMLHIYSLIRRRISWNANKSNENNILQSGPLQLHYIFRKVFWNKQELFLTKHEFNLLYLLASTPYSVYTFEQIYEIVWEEQCHGDINNIIWCLVRRIRKKLNKIEPRAGDIIKSSRNIGYSFEPIEDKNT